MIAKSVRERRKNSLKCEKDEKKNHKKEGMWREITKKQKGSVLKKKF
jgi:hypothetical protein